MNDTCVSVTLLELTTDCNATCLADITGNAAKILKLVFR